MTLENNGKLEPKTFDQDPHPIKLPPPKPSGELEFVLIQDKGVTLTLDDGSLYTSLGVIMTNQKGVSGYVTALIKDGYLIISLINRDDEYG